MTATDIQQTLITQLENIREAVDDDGTDMLWSVYATDAIESATKGEYETTRAHLMWMFQILAEASVEVGIAIHQLSHLTKKD